MMKLVTKDEFFAIIFANELDVHPTPEGAYPYTSVFKYRDGREFGRVVEAYVGAHVEGTYWVTLDSRISLDVEGHAMHFLYAKHYPFGDMAGHDEYRVRAFRTVKDRDAWVSLGADQHASPAYRCSVGAASLSPLERVRAVCDLSRRDRSRLVRPAGA